MTGRTAGLLLRQARAASGLSQRRLAAKARDHQPNVAAIESGARDAQCETLSRLIRASGGHLSVLPTTSDTVADVADEIAHLLAQGHERQAYRAFIGLHDDLVHAPPALRVALCVAPPAPVGDIRYDALLAALVEHDLEGLPVPEWATDPTRDARDWWLEDLPAIRELVRARTPAAFSRHGIWLDRDELASA
jgi:transcriptional regulator with XRE-family HTH domain